MHGFNAPAAFPQLTMSQCVDAWVEFLGTKNTRIQSKHEQTTPFGFFSGRLVQRTGHPSAQGHSDSQKLDAIMVSKNQTPIWGPFPEQKRSPPKVKAHCAPSPFVDQIIAPFLASFLGPLFSHGQNKKSNESTKQNMLCRTIATHFALTDWKSTATSLTFSTQE